MQSNGNVSGSQTRERSKKVNVCCLKRWTEENSFWHLQGGTRGLTKPWKRCCHVFHGVDKLVGKASLWETLGILHITGLSPSWSKWHTFAACGEQEGASPCRLSAQHFFIPESCYVFALGNLDSPFYLPAREHPCSWVWQLALHPPTSSGFPSVITALYGLTSSYWITQSLPSEYYNKFKRSILLYPLCRWRWELRWLCGALIPTSPLQPHSR